MSSKEYWDDDPELVTFYREAFEMKKQQINTYEWLMGRYMYSVLEDFAEILVTVPRKGAKVKPYLEEPYPLSKEEVIEKEIQKRAKKEEEIKAKMMAFATRINKKFEERG